MEGCEAESRKVVNLPPGKNIPEGKPSSQNKTKLGVAWVCQGCVIGASIVFRDRATEMFSLLWCEVVSSKGDADFAIVNKSNKRISRH